MHWWSPPFSLRSLLGYYERLRECTCAARGICSYGTVEWVAPTTISISLGTPPQSKVRGGLGQRVSGAQISVSASPINQHIPEADWITKPRDMARGFVLRSLQVILLQAETWGPLICHTHQWTKARTRKQLRLKTNAGKHRCKPASKTGAVELFMFAKDKTGPPTPIFFQIQKVICCRSNSGLCGRCSVVSNSL